MNRRERRAARQKSKAASSAAMTPAALCELGHHHLEAGRTLDAQLCCRQALAIDPSFADALYLMGLLAQNAEQFDHAIVWFSRAIEQEEKPRFLLSLGHALKRHGRLEDAFKAFDRAVELDIDSAEAWKPLAQFLADLNRRDEAALAFQHALKLDPQDADAAHQAGFLTYHAGKAEAALALFDQSDRLRANHAPTLHMRSLALAGLGRFEEAADELARAHRLAPDDADICNDGGVFLRRLGRHEEALTWFDKALALRANVKVSLNKAFTLERLQRFDEARAIYVDIKAADPDNAGADFNTGLLQLQAGDYETGWALREARWKVSSLSIARYDFDRPMWQGKEPIAGKTILIYQDEGLGDVIQFARYVPMLASLGARVILVVDDALLPLLSRLPGVAECLSRSVRRNVSFDARCAITSLAWAFNTRLETIPSAVPYLPAPEESRRRVWEQRLGPRDRMRVGIAWSGNPRNDDNHNRSVPLDILAPLLDLDATFVRLHRDLLPQDKEALSRQTRIVDFTAVLADLADTAALMSCLDLVISTDTSVAHLAAALACPTWILLQYTPDWRWLLGRDDSPWYPTARLFRQSEIGNYVDVVERLRSELAAHLAGWSIRAPVRSEGAAPFSKEEAAAIVERGFAEMREGRYTHGLALIDEADRRLPDHAPTLHMRALAKYGGGQIEDALDDLGRAHALDPDNAEICNNMGVIVRNLGREEEALGWFDKAIDRKPDFMAALGNRASSLGSLRRFDEAFAVYAALKQIDPGNADADWAAALLHLLIGDFQAGWAGREARWKVPHLSMARYNFPQPMWLGKEPIAGKTILIHQDEGLGDTIQFARYVPMVASRGARVILLVQDALVPLLSKLPGVAACWPMSGEQGVSFDMFCAISSLPLAFGTMLETIPSAVPYLPMPDAARVQAWEQRLGVHDRLRVGLVWSGNPKHKNDHNRSLPLAALSPLFDLDATFVSLQKEVRPHDQATLRERPTIIDPTGHLADFVETAALVSCLDLIITVDTSMAHLAGALGRPTWILLPYAPDYRWLLDRKDSPWYPTARLFRQPKAGDHASVIARVRAELDACIAQWSVSTVQMRAVAALYETGLALMQAGRFAEAAPPCTQALALDPDHADTLHLMGLLSLQNQHYDVAVEWFSRAIRRNPAPLYLRSLGTALLNLGRREEAVQVFDKAVQLKPDDADLRRNLGQALGELGRADEAIMSFGQAIKLNPRDFDAAHNAALLTYQAERYEEALTYFTRCEELQAGHFPSVYMRALTLQNLQRFEEALAGNQRALALDPLSADTWHNMGNVLRALFRPEQAIACYDRALALRPNNAATLGNKAVALAELRRIDEAVATFRAAIAADPDDVAAQWNLALLQLLLGDFEAGWAAQEARWKNTSLSSSHYPAFSQPKWLGAEPLAGKTVLAYANEGIGDAIQFVRYMPMLAARGARVVLVVPDPLCPLLSGMEGIAECRPQSAMPLPDCDFHVPLSSLPLAFATRLDTIPAQRSYLPAPAAQRVRAFETRLGPHDRLRVGLVWAGNPKHRNDRNRSLPLSLLFSLLDLGASFVSLQKQPKPDDLALLAERREIVDLTANLSDFAETAALIACLDLVISVDTSVAHLAAALGCPTWIFLPYTPDFRWLLDRADSPWYPTARLFRQTESCEYQSVIARVRGELNSCIADWSAQRGKADPAPSAETLHLMGLSALNGKNHDQAVELLSRAIRSDPKPLYLTSLGTTLLSAGRREEAIQVFDKAVQLNPGDADLWRNLGLALAEAGRAGEAILSFLQALELDPRHFEAAHKAGLLFCEAERYEEAIGCFDRCEELQADHFATLYMRALAQQKLRRFEEALADNRRALALNPDSADVRYNLANVLSELRRFDEAIAVHRDTLARNPDDANAQWSLALLQLLLGDFAQGWAGREARWKIPALSAGYPKFSQPLWLGRKALAGKTLLVWADEGLGDTIQFVRYVPMLAGRGARITLLTDAALCSLLSGVEGVAQSLPRSAGAPATDFHIPLSSLPLAFGTRPDTIPAATPYLSAPSERLGAWTERLGAHDKMRIGLVWSGNPKHGNDCNRSLALALLKPLLDLEVTFVSLQKQTRTEDRALLAEAGIVDVAADLTDFAETAALISRLDLVITVDTSVAHLAGALGCATWILLPYSPDYRWLLDRDDSLWYPTARLFRQDENRDYARVIARLRGELIARIAAWSPPAWLGLTDLPGQHL